MAANPMCSMLSAIAGLNALLAKLNVSTAGSISIYSGAMPASCETAASGTLLSSGLTLSTTAFPTAVDGSNGLATATASTISSDTSAAASGTAGYFRGLSSAGTCIIQGTCGTSAADMILNTTSIVIGSTVAVTSWVVTLPTGASAD